MDFCISFKEISIDRKGNVIKEDYWGPNRIFLMSLCNRFCTKLYQVLCNSNNNVNVDSVVFTIVTSKRYKPKFKLEINDCLITQHSSEGTFADFIIDITKILYFVDYRNKIDI